MANPTFATCTKEVWTKVATSILSGNIRKTGFETNKYFYTYKITGGVAPTKQSEGVLIFQNTNLEIISSSSRIDVYIMATGINSIVRVDIL